MCEFINGNSEYAEYFKDGIVITKLNQIELFLLREFGLEKAKEFYFYLEPYAEDFDYDVMEKAMLFRLENKKRKLSCCDCIGYAYSLLNKIMFLTGDREFKKLNNVEFVV